MGFWKIVIICYAGFVCFLVGSKATFKLDENRIGMSSHAASKLKEQCEQQLPRDKKCVMLFAVESDQ